MGSTAISRPSSPDLSALSAPATPESWPGGTPGNTGNTPTTKENGLIAQKGSNRKRPIKMDEDSQVCNDMLYWRQCGEINAS